MNHHETTANTKPSTMETIKDKASHLVHKITGKTHDATDHHNTTHAHTGSAVPHGNTVDYSAYNSQAGAPASTLPVNSHHADYKDPHSHANPLSKDHHNHADPLRNDHHHNVHGTAATAGAAAGAIGGLNTASVQHPAPAGPTGTTNVPTFSQNIPPTAAGVVPTAHAAEHVHNPVVGQHAQHPHNGAPINTNNSTVPVNANNVHQTAPVHNTDKTVPAMGAPGTTTAAGTHVPCNYNPNSATTTAAGTQIPGQYNTSGAVDNHRL
ncbi:hypothetical protein BX616_010063 [Lobosporangium transversale]|uniref:Uncharacterized protein n=1 Tax=Lobosporangium transversale TaxID=64571 RepID=A0A1Y2GXS6_9FUNG|nr:hypothetical protein BCR41DRAFT_347404 [Lobosporangium transversale]KAF9913413.1 hypothetical protein BX616_010063 [Lobosporangium transversale]ORZ27090.1 hypothetical protein BCR41DRAFT_347404 [Lobosporangium transversale]|eukprot:XP_021884837.1 hypothetical protein BCR41DRAFT_347404 [Lobosporangium transversale]